MDSDINNRKLLHYFLEGLDYTITDADTTQALLKQHAQYPAHLVVIDIDSLDAPITELIAELHKIDSRYNQPPVMVVAIVSAQTSNIMNSGVVAVLNKPVNHTEFRGLLLKLLPERIINTGRTAPQWAIEDDIAPMDFNKVTITPMVQEESTQHASPKYSQPAVVGMNVQSETNTFFTTNNHTEKEAITVESEQTLTEVITDVEKKTIETIQKEIENIPDYLAPAIPTLLSLFTQQMENAKQALQMNDYYKISDIANKIATESKRFNISSIMKIAMCIERASTESDDSAVSILFQELSNAMDIALTLLVKYYERQKI